MPEVEITLTEESAHLLPRSLAAHDLSYRQEAGRCFCRLDDEGEKLAVCLAEFMFGPWEDWRLHKLMSDDQLSLNAQESQLVLTAARELIEAPGYPMSPFCGRQRQQHLASVLQGFLRQGRVDLDGVVRFYLAGYEDFLRAIFILSLDEALRFREDERYFRLLRSQMAEREATERCHLLLHGQTYALWCEKDGSLLLQEGGSVGAEAALVMAAILHAAPNQLVIHGAKVPESALLKQLRQLFSGRLTFCAGCSLCQG